MHEFYKLKAIMRMNMSTKTTLRKGLIGLLIAYFLPLTAFAQAEAPLLAPAAETFDGISYYFDEDTRTATVTSNSSGYYGDIIIPEYVIRNDIRYTVTSIGMTAFSSCLSMRSVTMPNTVVSIGNNAFKQCMSLHTVKFSNNLKEIGQFAFNRCSALKEVNLPNGLSTLGTQAFSECSSLQSLTLPESLTSLGATCFYGCSSLASVSLPESLTELPLQTFMSCTKLASVQFPKRMVSIANNAFKGCSSLIEVIVPNALTTISQGAFSGCSSLKTVTIGSSLQEVRSRAFENCTSLTDFYCYAYSVPTTADDAFQGASIASALLHVPVTSIAAYKATEPWCHFKFISEMDTPYYLYEVGAETNWGVSHPLHRISDSKYQGYYYLADVFRVKPYEQWEEDWGYGGATGLLLRGSSTNIPVPSPGFYQLTVDLSTQTYTLVAIKTVSIAGDFNSWGKDTVKTDVEMTYNVQTGIWTANADFDKPSKYKFRANHSWDINWGGTEKNIVTGGDTLFVGAAAYKFELFLAYDGGSKLTRTQTSQPKKCGKPIIMFTNGELHFASATEGAVYNYSIVATDNKKGTASIVPLGGLYSISVVAEADGYLPSDTTKATIEWRNGKPFMKGFATVTLVEDELKADLNDDGQISVADITTIIGIIAAKNEKENEGGEETGEGTGDDNGEGTGGDDNGEGTGGDDNGEGTGDNGEDGGSTTK